jgi:hypothetical protein
VPAQRSPCGRKPRDRLAAAPDEYLLDEAVEETFPASDPPAETQPGSIVAQRYAATESPPSGHSLGSPLASRSLGWLPFAALAAEAPSRCSCCAAARRKPARAQTARIRVDVYWPFCGVEHSRHAGRCRPHLDGGVEWAD